MNHKYILLKTKIKTFITPVRNTKWMKLKTDSRKVYVFLAGFYQNLGDMAITYAQKEFLRKCYPEAEIVLVSSTETYLAVKAIKQFIKPDDVITINGGGNTSDVYQSLEDARLHVVKNFPNNRIVLFPQTVWFTDGTAGRKSLSRSRKVYEKHKNLVMAARETASFERIQEYFPKVKSICCPDVVLSIEKRETESTRKGCLLCLRSDVEKNLSDGLKDALVKDVESNFENVVITDTVDVSIEDCTAEKYEDTLNAFWNKLRCSEVVLTDRLHCMLFCVITGTPCVALDNANHKISGVYESWLKGITYVSLTTADNKQIIEEMKRLSRMKQSDLHYSAAELFAPLYDAIKNN